MDSVIIYTDGSFSQKSKEGGYAALVVKQGSQTALLIKGSQKDTTSQRMELVAALKALQALEKPSMVDLVSDSSYLVNTIKKKWYDNWDLNGKKGRKRKNADLWIGLTTQMKRHKINPILILGHQDGEIWNNMVDGFAVQARLNKCPDTIKEIDGSTK